MTGKILKVNSSILSMLVQLGTLAAGPVSAQHARHTTVITQSKSVNYVNISLSHFKSINLSSLFRFWHRA